MIASVVLENQYWTRKNILKFSCIILVMDKVFVDLEIGFLRTHDNLPVSLQPGLAWSLPPWLLQLLPGMDGHPSPPQVSSLLHHETNFSSVLRDQWKKVKRNKLAAAREAALTNEQVTNHFL